MPRATGPVRACAAALLLALAGAAAAPAPARADDDGPVYDLLYEARLLPSQGLARVEVRVDQEDGALRALEFGFEPERFFRFGADGRIDVDSDHLVWSVPPEGGVLRYSVKVDHLRDAAAYDARLTRDWALFRGTDLFPTSASRTATGAHARARLRLRVPPRWKVVTPFSRDGNGSYRIEQEDRRLDRPGGWMLLGQDPSVRRADVEGMQVVVAGPPKQDVRARDILALLRWTLPHLHEAVGALPERLLVVSADDPMWRGGLSGPTSLYLHADRPLVEEDGTSPLLHELVHVVSHAVGRDGGDWIVEGLAEYYSLELLRRSGTVSEEEHAATLDVFRRRARKAGDLATSGPGSAVTARAVLVLDALDAAIRERTDGAQSLDDVLRALVREPTVVTPASFRALLREEIGADVSDVLPESEA